MKRPRLPKFVNRPYFDLFLGQWCCPNCYFSSMDRQTVKNHFKNYHGLTERKGKGVIL